MRRLIVAGLASGVGKTTITCALLAAYARRGHRVQPFKAGPDYLDPTHHTAAAGRPSRNLDAVMLPPAALRELFARAAAGADLSVIEGVMGLFDGRTGHGEAGSTAQLAKLLAAPVVLVLDVVRVARTAGAVALGACSFDPTVPIAGFILNRVGSDAHARTCSEAIETATGLPVLGAVPRDEGAFFPERHLGLVPATETLWSAERTAQLASLAERHLDLARLWDIAGAAPLPVSDPGPWLFPAEAQPQCATIAVAQDAAFGFYYADSLDLLHAWGAEFAPFSPLADVALPPGTQGVYVGGGFPELHAAELAANVPMQRALRQAAQAGLPIYGECGGLMYLGRSLTDFAGARHSMVGLVPFDSRMTRDRLTLGYRAVTTLRASPLLRAGVSVIGHEFHYSELDASPPETTAAYRVDGSAPRWEGYLTDSVLASYVHVHFASDPAIAQRFIAKCTAAAPLGAS
ncbi:MAG: cobyrinic acid a,c-diamide synthase [Chloroflexota bacterium]|jgi:cobyrinic acid a,c-diamide synthase|nr:cobyrinic acid a,c-diamide synthase [Chloroflexota bacterium]